MTSSIFRHPSTLKLHSIRQLVLTFSGMESDSCRGLTFVKYSLMESSDNGVVEEILNLKCTTPRNRTTFQNMQARQHLFIKWKDQLKKSRPSVIKMITLKTVGHWRRHLENMLTFLGFVLFFAANNKLFLHLDHCKKNKEEKDPTDYGWVSWRRSCQSSRKTRCQGCSRRSCQSVRQTK